MFWAVYFGTGEAKPEWTGDKAACDAGDSGEAFRLAALDRLNLYRLLAGVPPVLATDPEWDAKAQEAALVMSVNQLLTHFPEPDLHCYSEAAREAAGHSALALGECGPEAIDGYIEDFGATNSHVGHRRWLLFPNLTRVGLGDIPKTPEGPAANATWVVDPDAPETRPSVRDQFVAWPPPGFVPYQLVHARWSFSLPGADFTAASVTMTRNGEPVPVATEPVEEGFGENTLVWHPDDIDPNAPYAMPRPESDVSYSIHIAGVVLDGATNHYAYETVVFDPAAPGPSEPEIAGPAETPLLQSALFRLAAPTPGADAYEWRLGSLLPFEAKAGVGVQPSAFLNKTDPDYSPFTPYEDAPNYFYYHLTHPRAGAADQILCFREPICPRGTNAALRFYSLLSWASTNQAAKVQISGDEGRTWRDLFVQIGSGDEGETNFHEIKVPLTNYVGRAAALRFNYASLGGEIFVAAQLGVGWHFYNIQFDDVERLFRPQQTVLDPEGQAVFTPRIPGAVGAQTRGLVWGRYPLEWGPLFESAAVPADPLQSWIRSVRLVPPDQMAVEFLLPANPPSPRIYVEQAPDLVGPWTRIKKPQIAPQEEPGTYEALFAAPASGGPWYYRLSVESP